MAARDLAAALQRAESVLQRRPSQGVHDDAPATARWEGATRVVASHANGTRVATDMPEELGGSGDQVSPGWLFRAAFASCAATSIAMSAARQGIELDSLELRACSRSDARGLLGMEQADGARVPARPSDLQLVVRIFARGVAPQRLHTLVEDSLRRSPIPCAVQEALPVAFQIEIRAG